MVDENVLKTENAMANILFDIVDLNMDYERERDDMASRQDLDAIEQRLKECREHLLTSAKMYVQLYE